MTLSRSKSAPNGLPGLAPTPLVRAASFHTIEEAVKDIKLGAVEEQREEAFNLAGFFPRERDWGWMREEEAKGGVKGGSLFGTSDKMIQEAIKGEDKMGVLSLGSLLKRLGLGREEEKEGKGGNRLRYDEPGAWLGDWTGTSASLDGGDWRTPLDTVIDDYFPIWDFDPGNSRHTKLPHSG